MLWNSLFDEYWDQRVATSEGRLVSRSRISLWRAGHQRRWLLWMFQIRSHIIKDEVRWLFNRSNAALFRKSVGFLLRGVMFCEIELSRQSALHTMGVWHFEWSLGFAYCSPGVGGCRAIFWIHKRRLPRFWRALAHSTSCIWCKSTRRICLQSGESVSTAMTTPWQMHSNGYDKCCCIAFETRCRPMMSRSWMALTRSSLSSLSPSKWSIRRWLDDSE